MEEIKLKLSAWLNIFTCEYIFVVIWVNWSFNVSTIYPISPTIFYRHPTVLSSWALPAQYNRHNASSHILFHFLAFSFSDARLCLIWYHDRLCNIHMEKHSHRHTADTSSASRSQHDGYQPLSILLFRYTDLYTEFSSLPPQQTAPPWNKVKNKFPLVQNNILFERNKKININKKIEILTHMFLKKEK